MSQPSLGECSSQTIETSRKSVGIPREKFVTIARRLLEAYLTDRKQAYVVQWCEGHVDHRGRKWKNGYGVLLQQAVTAELPSEREKAYATSLIKQMVAFEEFLKGGETVENVQPSVTSHDAEGNNCVK